MCAGSFGSVYSHGVAVLYRPILECRSVVCEFDGRFVLSWPFVVLFFCVASIYAPNRNPGSNWEGRRQVPRFTRLSKYQAVVWFFFFPGVLRSFFFFSFSVTLPGTYAGRSALTRGKPIFLYCLL